jgi:hypothetical protein
MNGSLFYTMIVYPKLMHLKMDIQLLNIWGATSNYIFMKITISSTYLWLVFFLE